MKRKRILTVLFTLVSGILLTSCITEGVGDENNKRKSGDVDQYIKAMSFNLRYENSTDISPHTWSERRPTIQQVIKEEGPDIIGIQEGLHNQVFEIDQYLSEYSWIGLGREGGSYGEHVSIFYKDEYYYPLEYDHYWLSRTPEVIGSKTWGNSIPRMVTWVKFENKNTQDKFYVINTHFDHESVNARQQSSHLINDQISNSFEDLPIILMGDFNEVINGRSHKILTDRDMFKDAWEIATEKINDDIGTFNGFNDSTGGGSNNKIDWILTKEMNVHSMKVNNYRGENGQYPSDHYPVVAELELRKGDREDVLLRYMGKDNNRMSKEEGINGPLRISGDAVVNTFDGAWVAYEELDFSNVEVDSLKINYVVNESRSAPDSKVLIYADEMDDEHLITEAKLSPTTDSDWDAYESVEIDIEDPSLLNDIHDIYILMEGSTTESNPYIINFKYMQFQGTSK